jgi:hypothetical protein
LFFIPALALLTVTGVVALDENALNWWTADNGGGMNSNGGSYSLSGTIGQPDAGISTGGTYTLNGGFWYPDWDPTAVTLMSFTAIVEKKPTDAATKSVILSWKTTSEVDNLGFNLYRTSSANGARTRINAALIPTLVHPGSPFGVVYLYKDTGLINNTIYYYWLESVDNHGNSDLTGPVVVKLVAGKPR